MASVNAEKIKELLGNGLSNDVVATAVGVHPSYISQLMADEEFSNQVVALRSQTLTDATTRDRSWDSLENKLLSQLHENVDNKMVYKTTDVTRVLALANAAKRRGASSSESMVTHQTVITLNLPTVVVNSYRKNIQGEVVEVTTPEGKTQTLVTMPAASLMHKLSEQHQGNKNYEQVRKYLPGSS